MPDLRAPLYPTGKPKRQSLTIKAGASGLATAIAAIVVLLLKSLWGIEIPAEDVAAVIAAAVMAVQFILTIVGRIRATETVR